MRCEVSLRETEKSTNWAANEIFRLIDIWFSRQTIFYFHIVNQCAFRSVKTKTTNQNAGKRAWYSYVYSNRFSVWRPFVFFCVSVANKFTNEQKRGYFDCRQNNFILWPVHVFRIVFRVWICRLLIRVERAASVRCSDRKLCGCEAIWLDRS